MKGTDLYRWRTMVSTMESGDPEGALYQLKAMAKQGNIDAMAEIGVIYESGPAPISRDLQCALKWFRKAADAGHLEGMLGLARLYLLGGDIPTDYQQAREIYEMVVNDVEDRRALFALGWIYHCGLGIDKDASKAHKYYGRAARVGHLLAPKWQASVYRQEGKNLQSFSLWLVSIVRIWWVSLTKRRSMRLHRQL